MGLYKNLKTNVQSNFISNSPNLKTTQMFTIGGWINKPCYIYSMECHLAKKKGMNYWYSNNTDEPQNGYAGWQKWNWKRTHTVLFHLHKITERNIHSGRKKIICSWGGKKTWKGMTEEVEKTK